VLKHGIQNTDQIVQNGFIDTLNYFVMITKYFSVFFAILLTSGMIAGSQSAFAGFPCPPGFTPNGVSGLCEMPANASCPPPSVGPNAAGMCETQPITACPAGGALNIPGTLCVDGPACIIGSPTPAGNCGTPPTCPIPGSIIQGVCTTSPVPLIGCLFPYSPGGPLGCQTPVQCIPTFNFNSGTVMCESPNLCPALYGPNQGSGLCEAQPTQSCLSPSVGPNPTGLCDQPPALSCTQGTLMGLVCTLERLASEIGGKIMGVNSSALLLAGATTTSAWLIPVLVSAVGIGIILVRRD